MMRKSPFIADQAWSVLNLADSKISLPTVLRHIEADRRRDEVSFEECWEQAPPRREFLLNLTTDPNWKYTCFLHRAGMGKTKTSEYLAAVLMKSPFDMFVVHITASELQSLSKPGGLAQALLNHAEAQAIFAFGGVSVPEAETIHNQIIFQLRRGRMLLLVDALDQTTEADFGPLQDLLQSKDGLWEHCRLIVTGRPYAILSQTNATSLFGGENWRFVRLEPFTEAQCQKFLEGYPEALERFNGLPDTTRQILTNPRMLSYFLQVDVAQLENIRTAADVLFQALNNMFKEAMRKRPSTQLSSKEVNRDSERVASDPTQGDLHEIWKAFSTIAFLMTRSPANGRPNFVKIGKLNASQDYNQLPEFKVLLGNVIYSDPRIGPRERGELVDQLLVALGDLNAALRGDLLEQGVKGLTELQFQNRTLQEFLCAYYLSNFTRHQPVEGVPWNDMDEIWNKDWIVEWDLPETEAYEDIWRFVCDMPREARQPGPWLNAVSVLYRPGYPDEAGEWCAKRSPEFIYRTWFEVQSISKWGTKQDPNPLRSDSEGAVGKGALRILENWQGEFERILNGEQDAERQQQAEALKDDFLEFPAGPVRFGSKSGGVEAAAAWREVIQDLVDHRDQSDEDLDRRICRYWPNIASAQKRNRERQLSAWRSNVRNHSVEALLNYFLPQNERTPKGEERQWIAKFRLLRRPVTNGWLRLFVPKHGLRGESQFLGDYKRISQTNDHPAIFVDFWTARLFSLWVKWGTQVCRLPFENEFEYACKYGLSEKAQLEQDYWWEGKLQEDDERCIANQSWETGKTKIASPKRASEGTKGLDLAKELGCMDLLGNVNEWQMDVYRDPYVRTETDLIDLGEGAERVFRGGGWDEPAEFCRSANRYGNDPGNRIVRMGFRLCLSSAEPS